MGGASIPVFLNRLNHSKWGVPDSKVMDGVNLMLSRDGKDLRNDHGISLLT
jgi:hypothetical protein